MAELAAVGPSARLVGASQQESRDAQFVTFEVDGALLGIDIHVVKEINPSVLLTAVPRAPVFVRGVVNIRGQVVLVLDLAVIMGQPASPQACQVVILKTAPELRDSRLFDETFDTRPFGDKPLALLVDQLGDVLVVARHRIARAPAHVSEASRRYIAGVVELDQQLLVILDPCTLLSQDAAR